jgi:hypothetical protein
MSATIKFYRQLRRRRIEIRYVAAKRMLAAKFVSREVSIPQMPPESALSFGCLFPQHASAVHERAL